MSAFVETLNSVEVLQQRKDTLKALAAQKSAELIDLELRILARGETAVKVTSCYRVFTRSKSLSGETLAKGWFYYVGPSGAIRTGTTASNSRPLHDRAKAVLVAEGRELLAPPKRQTLDEILGGVHVS